MYILCLFAISTSLYFCPLSAWIICVFAIEVLFVCFFIFLKVKSCIYFIFIFGCVGSSLLRAGATLRFSARASHSGGFSFCGAWALGARPSVAVARGL